MPQTRIHEEPPTSDEDVRSQVEKKYGASESQDHHCGESTNFGSGSNPEYIWRSVYSVEADWKVWRSIADYSGDL